MAFNKAKQLATFSRVWYLFDAKWQCPHSSGERIARILRGEHKPIYYPGESTGDCVVAINTRHIAVRNDAWRAEALHVRREYAKTKYDIPLFKLHELDPTKVLHLCVLNCMPKDNSRRYDMARLYTFPDDAVPAHLLKNVCDQIHGSRVIPNRLDDLKPEDIKNFPQMFKWPKELVLDDLDRDKFVRVVPPEEMPKRQVMLGQRAGKQNYWFHVATSRHEEVKIN